MKILLDECLPRKLAKFLIGHETLAVTQMGWSGIKNGQLLSRAQTQFDIFLTVDKNLESQQNLSKYSIGILVLRSGSNDIDELLLLVPEILELLKKGKFTGAKYIGT